MTAAVASCFISLFIFLTYSACIVHGHWNYNREDMWPPLCKTGQQQSPIALSTDIAEEGSFSSLIFEKFDGTYPVRLKNNGHSAEIRLSVQQHPSIAGGGLPHVYALDHLHFHWESEHTVNGIRFPLEMHLVFYSNLYPNISTALQYTGGVAVFAVLFDLSRDDDQHFEPLIEVIDKLHDKVNEVHEIHLNIDRFLPRDKAGFYRYNGSLTTPSCAEGLIWTVFTNRIPISSAQVAAFSHLHTESHEEIHTNYRSLQELNGRRVQVQISPLPSHLPSAANLTLFISLERILVLLIGSNILRYIVI